MWYVLIMLSEVNGLCPLISFKIFLDLLCLLYQSATMFFHIDLVASILQRFISLVSFAQSLYVSLKLHLLQYLYCLYLAC